MAKKVEGKFYESLTGQLFELGRQLRQKNGYPFDPAMLQLHLQNAIEGRFTTVDVARNEFLELISGNETLTLDACDGTKILVEVNDVFKYIDPDLKNWGADQRGEATTETPVEVYEVKRDATFSQMFNSLASDVRRLCLTQNQIIGFIKKYRSWLRADGYGTFFMFESNSEYFVVDVYFNSNDTLSVYVVRLEYSDVWRAESRHRVVTPQVA